MRASGGSAAGCSTNASANIAAHSEASCGAGCDGGPDSSSSSSGGLDDETLRDIAGAVASLASGDYLSGFSTLFDIGEATHVGNRKRYEFQSAVAAAGGIPLLVRGLVSRRGGCAGQTLGAYILQLLAVFNPDIRRAIAAAGGTEILTELLSSPDAGVRERAAGVLAQMNEGDVDEKIVPESVVRPMVAGLLSPTVTLGIQEQVVAFLHAKSSGGRANAATNRLLIAAAGAVPPLVSLLSSPSIWVQKYSANTLWNLSVEEKNKGTVAVAGAIPPLIALLDSLDEGVQRGAAGALWNLSTSHKHGSDIAASGGIPALVALLRSTASPGHAQELAVQAIWSLSLVDGNLEPIVVAGAIPHLVALLASPPHSEAASGALMSLSTCAEYKAAIVCAGAIPHLLALLASSSTDGQYRSALTLYSLSLDEDIKTKLVAAGAVPPLILLLDSPSVEVQQAAAGALSNFAFNGTRAVGCALKEQLL